MAHAIAAPQASTVPDRPAAPLGCAGPAEGGADVPSQDALVNAALGGYLRTLAAPPNGFSYSGFAMFERCPLAYALKYVCRLEPPEPVPAFAFGTAAHRAFELFTAERRSRAESDLPAPVREDLDRCFAEAWKAADFGDEETKVAWSTRVTPMLDAFWAAEAHRKSSTLAEETLFCLEFDDADGTTGWLSGVIDRLDRLPDGSVELIDYKTGDAWGPVEQSFGLQLAIYAVGCADALGIGAPRRGLLYFVEHGLFAVKPVSGDTLESTRREIAARAAAIRASDFAATPGPKACRWCDYRTICPEVPRD